MIQWYTQLHDVRPNLDHPTALIAASDVLDTLPPLSRDQLADAAHGGLPSVRRRQLLCALAARVLDITPVAVRLGIASDERRYVRGTNVFASVAYRSGVAAVALAHEPIGIDVESIDEALAAGSVALNGFDGNVSALAAWHGPAGVWTAKEAALKALSKDLTNCIGQWRFDDMAIAYDCKASRNVAHIALGHTIACVVVV